MKFVTEDKEEPKTIVRLRQDIDGVSIVVGKGDKSQMIATLSNSGMLRLHPLGPIAASELGLVVDKGNLIKIF